MQRQIIQPAICKSVAIVFRVLHFRDQVCFREEGDAALHVAEAGLGEGGDERGRHDFVVARASFHRGEDPPVAGAEVAEGFGVEFHDRGDGVLR